MTQMLMVDVNGYRVPTSLAAHYRAGYRLLGVKVTQGGGAHAYTWQQGLAIIDAWHQLGKDAHCAVYHFATAGIDGATQANHFLNTVNPHLRWGDKYCIDIEAQPKSYRQWAHGEAKRVHDAFIDRVNAAGRRWGTLRRKRLSGLTYIGPYFITETGIRKRGGWRLWLAAYGPQVIADWTRRFRAAGWLTWMAWQFTDAREGVSGMPASLDCSQIKKWMLT